MSLLNNWLNADLFSVLRDKVNAVVTVVNFFAGGTTGQIPIKSNATDFNYILSNSVLPDSGGANIKIKKVSIGDWNMDTTANILVAHGVSNYKKILNVSVVVRDDSDVGYYVSPYLNPSDLLSHNLDGTSNISIARVNSSFFDSVDFDSTSYNRGFITITYES